MYSGRVWQGFGLRCARLTLAAALCACFLALATRDASAAPAGFYGVSPVTVLSPSEMTTAKQGGVSTIRPLFAWNNVEPAPDSFDFTRTDEIVTNATEAGVDVTPLLFQTPTWASGCISDRRCLYVPPVATPELRSEWNEYVSQLVSRYGPNGSFWDPLTRITVGYQPIRDWIVWNEENGKTYFPPKASPTEFAGLLARSASTIRSIDSGATIILGGLAGGSNVDHNAGSMPAAEFLTKLYKHTGAKKNFDVVALHPYSATVKNLEKEVDADRAAMKKAHAGSTPVWLTELGWGSNKSSSSLSVGVKNQAKLLKASFTLVNKKRLAWNVKKLFWFTWRDVADTPCLWCGAAGLFTKSGAAKPSWSAYKKFAK
jgi:hypothetical protein